MDAAGDALVVSERFDFGGHGESNSLGVFAAARPTMRVTKFARRAARRGNIDCEITARTKNPAGGSTTSSEELFVLKRGS